MEMTVAAGTGWVLYIPVHWQVQERIEEFAKKTRRNSIKPLGDGVYQWIRPPKDERGVGKGNQKTDFERFVTNAITHPDLAVSTVHTQRLWDFDSRFGRDLVEITESGWDPVTPQQVEEAKETKRRILRTVERSWIREKIEEYEDEPASV